MQINRQSGFTIVEMIVVVGLMAIMIVVLTQVFLGGHQLYRTQNAELRVNNSARRALDDIDAYVRQAAQVANSYGPYTTSSTQLVLEVQSVNSTNQLIPGTFDTVVYYLSGSNVYRQIEAATGSSRASGIVLMAENVTSFTFTYDNASNPLVKKITTDVTVLETFGRETQSITVSSTSTLRN